MKIELKDNLCDQTSGSPVSVAHVALEVCKESVKNSLSISQIKPAPEESKRVLNVFGGQSNQNAGSNLAIEILPISIECITAISIARIKLPDNLNTHASIQCLRHCLTVRKTFKSCYLSAFRTYGCGTMVMYPNSILLKI